MHHLAQKLDISKFEITISEPSGADRSGSVWYSTGSCVLPDRPVPEKDDLQQIQTRNIREMSIQSKQNIKQILNVHTVKKGC